MIRTLKPSILILATALAFPAFAQEPGSPGASNKPMARPGAAPVTGDAGVGGSGTFSGWVSDYEAKHSGKISRQAYMDEVARRWDAADTNKQGLTRDQINRTYGGMGASGSVNTTPGYMGPKDVKK